MKASMKKVQTYKNLMMNALAFAVQFIISFYISPKIVSQVGAAAYGFLGLANDFVSYASILASVFNSVAARFIATSFYKKDYDTANRYFNSLIVANLGIAGFLGAAGIILVPNLENILTIPAELLFDVKVTFALIFASYIVSLVTLVFTTSTFVSNRTDIQGVRNIIQHIIRFALILVFLNFVSVRIYWVALATLGATVVVAVMNVDLTRRLTPELKINLSYAKKKYAFELAKSGSWMALTTISTILLRTLDLTVANVFIGEYEMGLLSIARTMPNNITSIINTLTPIFTPVFIALYTQNHMEDLLQNVKKTINTMAAILFVPISGFIVFSNDFYSLWQKSLTSQEIQIITILSITTVVQAYFNASTATMAQLSVVVNKLSLPVLVSLGCGIISITAQIFLIQYTDLGLWAIVICPTVVMVLRYVLFNSIYAAYCLKQKKAYFLPAVFKTWISIPFLIGAMLFIKWMHPVSTWLDLILDAALSGGIGYGLMFLLYYRTEVKSVLLKFLNRKKQ